MIEYRVRISVPADVESGPSLRAPAPGLAKTMADQPKSHRITTSVSAIGANTQYDEPISYHREPLRLVIQTYTYNGTLSGVLHLSNSDQIAKMP
jgi:hypothetical protein